MLIISQSNLGQILNKSVSVFNKWYSQRGKGTGKTEEAAEEIHQVTANMSVCPLSSKICKCPEYMWVRIFIKVF